MSDWSDCVSIEIAKSKRGPYNYLGIYQIRAVTSSGKPIPVPRLVGVDTLGILYVGRSGFFSRRSVANRIGEFVRQQHSRGITYARAKEVLDRTPKYARHSLQARVKILSTKKKLSLESRVHFKNIFQSMENFHRATRSSPTRERQTEINCAAEHLPADSATVAPFWHCGFPIRNVVSFRGALVAESAGDSVLAPDARFLSAERNSMLGKGLSETE